MCHSAKLRVRRDTVRSPVRIYPGARLTHALPYMANVSVTGGFSPSHEAAHVLPKCPSYKEETYAKTGEPNVTRPFLRQGADTPLGNRTERVLLLSSLGLGRKKKKKDLLLRAEFVDGRC